MPSLAACLASVAHRSNVAIQYLQRSPTNLARIADHLAAQGFHDFEFLGAGSEAMVVAPTDNPDLVFRISLYAPDTHQRFKLPQMLQTLATERLGAVEEDGHWYGGYTLEYAKRLDMEVNKQEIHAFMREASACGCTLHSFGGGAEVGHYHFTNQEGEECSVLMAADPSTLSPGGRPIGQRGCTAGYPTLADQIKENIRIANADPRLAGYVASLEKSLETVPHTPLLEGPRMPSRIQPGPGR